VLLLAEAKGQYTPGENRARRGRSEGERVSNSFRSGMYLNPSFLACEMRSLSSIRHDPV
jgi:hypothetical protein